MAQRALIVPRELTEKKPAHGSPCNNCGLCCWSSKCDVGRVLFGATETAPPACPALRFDKDGKSSCDVLVNTEMYTTHDPIEARAALALLLYAGRGCTMRINGEFNHAFNNRLDDEERRNRSLFDRARDIWKLPTEDVPF